MKKTEEELFNLIEDSLQRVSRLFDNGSGYYQQDIELVDSLKETLLKHFDNKYSFYWLGRILDDGGSSLYHCWCRLVCIDDAGREWDQQYYKNNPNEAKQVCFNPDFQIRISRKNKLNNIEKNIK